MSEKKDLAQIIQENPGCVARIDNDYWEISKNDAPPDNFNDWDDEKREAWWQSQIIAKSSDYDDSDSLYSGHYGWGVMQALAKIVGITVTGV